MIRFRFHRFSVHVIVLRISTGDVPTKHRTCFHGFFLRFRYAKFSVVLIDQSPRIFFACSGNIGLVVSFLIPLDNDYIIAAGKNAVALFRKVIPNRLISVAVLLHALCKLADVIEVISDLHMIVVDISARTDLIFVP